MVSAPLDPSAVARSSEVATANGSHVAAEDPSTHRAGSLRQYVVRTGDNLWDLAERFLSGDGLRYHEIWELNRDQMQPDGT
jgi:nucleoid-associated protein YgaU